MLSMKITQLRSLLSILFFLLTLIWATSVLAAQSGLWRTSNNEILYFQVLQNGDAMALLTKDFNQISTFYAGTLQDDIFEGHLISSSNQKDSLTIGFAGLEGYYTLVKDDYAVVDIGTVTLDPLGAALPDTVKDGIWSTGPGVSPGMFFIFQTWNSRNACAIKTSDASTGSFFLDQGTNKNSQFNGNSYPDPTNSSLVFSPDDQGTGEAVVTLSDGSTQTYALERIFEPALGQKLWGQVMLDKPIEGADISVYDMYGGLITTAPKATTSLGGYYLNLTGLPSGLIIKATGGTYDGQPFGGTFIREVDQYNSEYFYELNELTTLVAVYHANHPEISLEQAKNAVADYIKLPDYYTLDEVVAFCDYYTDIYDPEEFIRLMIKEFGEISFDEFIMFMAEDVDQGVMGPGMLKVAVRSGDPVEKTAFTIFKNVMGGIGGLLGEGSEIFGEIFDAIDSAEKNAEINAKLDQIMAGIKRIETSLDVLKTKISILNWHNIAQPIRDANTRFKADYKDMRQMVKTGAATPLAARKKWLADKTLIIKRDYATLLQGIHNACVGDFPGYDPVMKAWVDKTINELKSADTKPVYDNIESLFSRVMLIQMQGYQLLFNAYKYDKSQAMGQRKIRDFINTDVPKQNGHYLPNVERFVFSHRHWDYYYQQFPTTGDTATTTQAAFNRSDLARAYNYMDQITIKSGGTFIFAATPHEDVNLNVKLKRVDDGSTLNLGAGELKEVAGICPWDGSGHTWKYRVYRNTTSVQTGAYQFTGDSATFNPMVFDANNGITFQVANQVSNTATRGGFFALVTPIKKVYLWAPDSKRHVTQAQYEDGKGLNIHIPRYDSENPDQNQVIQYLIEPNKYVMGMGGGSTPGRYYLDGSQSRSYNPRDDKEGWCPFDMSTCPKYYRVVGAYPGGISRSGKDPGNFTWKYVEVDDKGDTHGQTRARFQRDGQEEGHGYLSTNPAFNYKASNVNRLPVLTGGTGLCCIATGYFTIFHEKLIQNWRY